MFFDSLKIRNRAIRSVTQVRNAPRIAILLVNGFDRRGQWGRYNETEALDYPWIDLCLRQVERNSKRWDYEVLVFDNTHLRRHQDLIRRYKRVRILPGRWFSSLGRIVNRIPGLYVGRLTELAHPRALDYLLNRVSTDFDYVVTLDTDSFPVRDDWLDVLINACEGGAALAGVYRDADGPDYPSVHTRQRSLCKPTRPLHSQCLLCPEKEPRYWPEHHRGVSATRPQDRTT